MHDTEKNDQFNIFEFIYLLVKWKKFIFINFLLVTATTAIISLFLAKWYSATASVMVIQEPGNSFLSTIIGSEALSMLGGSTGGDEKRQMAILQSRRLLESIVIEFDLKSEYKVELMEDALKILKNNLYFNYNRDLNILTITGYYKEDSIKAAELVNFTVKKLNDINIELSTEQARNNRLFIEKRYLQNLDDIKKSEEALNQFQNRNGIIEINEQTKVTIESIARILAEITTSEVEYNIARNSLGENHPEVIKIKSKINALNNKYAELRKEKNQSGLIMPLNIIPDLGLEYIRLFKEVQIQNKIQEFLIPQYEHAKIMEAKQTPVLSILDEAKPPEIRSKPKRSIIVFFSGIASLVLSILFVLAAEYWKNLKTLNSENYQLILKIINEFKLKKAKNHQ